MKRLLLLVVLPVTIIAALASKSKRAEAPGTEEGGATAAPEETAGLKGALASVRRHAHEALDAAHQAQAEKEADLRRDFDSARHGRT
jgi:uncharacterized membrane protein